MWWCVWATSISKQHHVVHKTTRWKMKKHDEIKCTMFSTQSFFLYLFFSCRDSREEKKPFFPFSCIWWSFVSTLMKRESREYNSGDCWVQKRIYKFTYFPLFHPFFFLISQQHISYFIHFNVSIECFLILVYKFVKIQSKTHSRQSRIKK